MGVWNLHISIESVLWREEWKDKNKRYAIRGKTLEDPTIEYVQTGGESSQKN